VTKLIDTLKDLKEIPDQNYYMFLRSKEKDTSRQKKNKLNGMPRDCLIKSQARSTKRNLRFLSLRNTRMSLGIRLLSWQKERKNIWYHSCDASGSSLRFMMEKMPDRAFDVGIASNMQ
jgi:1-deoxy-D-xylulose-5-phosphate synthase